MVVQGATRPLLALLGDLERILDLLPARDFGVGLRRLVRVRRLGAARHGVGRRRARRAVGLLL